MSNRKPHNENAGYIAERQYNGAHIVIYNAEEAGMDVDGKYAVVCEKHNCLVGTTSVPKAREIMKCPDFCQDCMRLFTFSWLIPNGSHSTRQNGNG